jgi:hypothetical protein
MHHLRRCRRISSRLMEIAMRRMAVSAALRCEPAWQHGAARPCPFIGERGSRELGISICGPPELLGRLIRRISGSASLVWWATPEGDSGAMNC